METQDTSENTKEINMVTVEVTLDDTPSIVQHIPRQSTVTTITDNGNSKSDTMETFRKEIDSLKTELAALKTLLKSTNTKSTDNLEAMQYLEKAQKHNKISDLLKGLRFILLFIFVVSYSTYQYSLYSNPEINQLSQSGIESAPQMEIPYFYFESYGATWNFFVEYVYIEIGNGYEEVHNVTTLLDSSNYVYNETTTNWTAIEVCGMYGHGWCRWGELPLKGVFLVPPHGLSLPVEQTLTVTIGQYGWYNDSTSPDTSSSNDSIAQYDGYLWEVAAIADIENKDLLDLQSQYFEQDEKLKLTLADTRSFHIIDLFEEINELKQPTTINMHYGLSYIASVWNVYGGHYGAILQYATSVTEFTVYQNPAGNGTKTTLRIIKRTKFTDLLANIGGIISPVITLSFILLTWVMFGLHIGIIRIDGIAQLAPLRYSQKQQIKLYLTQLGVLNPPSSKRS
eukprot:521836_1